jgi:hypothetical protein
MRSITLQIVSAALCACAVGNDYEPRNGDIVFQTSRSSQSLAIQLATKSPYSHMGIVYIREGRPMVFEAIQPVTLTPLGEWIARGERGHFVAKRTTSSRGMRSPNRSSSLACTAGCVRSKFHEN